MIVLLSAILIATAAVLSVVTTWLHRAASDIDEALESVRVAEALEIELMAHQRSMSLAAVVGQATYVPPVGSSARLRRLLVEARRHAPSVEERALVDRAEAAIGAYLTAERTEGLSAEQMMLALAPRFDHALAALDELTWFNVDEAHALEGRVARWDRLSDAMSIVAGALAVAGAAALLVSLKSQLFRALSDLHGAVRRFMSGDHDARAPVRGALEVREIATSFNTMAEQLERQEHDWLVFLGKLALDLRDPLTVIKLLSKPRDASDALDAPLVARQVQRMEHILRDVVDGALIASGRLELRRAPEDLRKPVVDSVDAYRALAPDHGFHVSVPDHPVVASVDLARVAHTLTNLLSNAVKFSPSGSDVWVSLEEADERAVLAVTDHGIGMSHEEMARAFEPFRRTGGARETIAGVGLGLAACRRIAEAHGGTLEVESEPGAGSTFRIALPLPPRQERTAAT